MPIWTAPKTWSSGETLTAANFNTHIRDNLNALSMHLLAQKTADETVNNSTTYQDDDHLFFSVAANEVWLLRFELMIISNSTADWKMQCTFPSGTAMGHVIEYGSADTVIQIDFNGASPAGYGALGLPGTNAGPRMLPVIFTNGGSAGTFRLQWAQNTATVIDTKVLANSTLWGVKLA